MDKKDKLESRRNFLKKAGYAVPVILTMKAMPALAGYGSNMRKGNNGIGQEKRGHYDGPPPGLEGRDYQDFNDNGSWTGGDGGRSGAQAGGGHSGPRGGGHS